MCSLSCVFTFLTRAELIVEKVREGLVALLRVLYGFRLWCRRVALGGRAWISKTNGVVFLSKSARARRVAKVVQRTVCCCMAAAVRLMPDVHRLASFPCASILVPPAFSTSSTSSILRFLPCDETAASRFSLSAKPFGMCDVIFLSGLRAWITSDDAAFLLIVDGELIARGVRSPRARLEGVWYGLWCVGTFAL